MMLNLADLEFGVYCGSEARCDDNVLQLENLKSVRLDNHHVRVGRKQIEQVASVSLRMHVREPIRTSPLAVTGAVVTAAPDGSLTIPVIFPVVDTWADKTRCEQIVNSMKQIKRSQDCPRAYPCARPMTRLLNPVPPLPFSFEKD